MNGATSQAENSFWTAPSNEGLLISDLSLCEPQSAIAGGPSQREWYLIPYATRDGIRGAMLGKGELARPEDVRLKLPAKGWHAIYLGLYRGAAEPDRPFKDPFLIRVKLSGDPLFDSIRPGVSDQVVPNRAVARYASAIEEFFWKARGPRSSRSDHLRRDQSDPHRGPARLCAIGPDGQRRGGGIPPGRQPRHEEPRGAT